MTKKEKALRSPLFYVGDKYKLYPKISEHFPKSINRFIEPFTGGGSVFLNVQAKEYLLNDIDSNVINIHKFLIAQAKDPDAFFEKVFQKIEHYNLSHSYIKDIVPQALKDKWKKTYYARFNKVGYNQLKADFNASDKEDILDLYLLLIFGFNRMLRFNLKGKFNLPVGNVDFNKNVLHSLNNYFEIMPKRKFQFYNLDFMEFFGNIKFKKDDFVYFDPPYLITFSEYNKIWNNKTEQKLIDFLDTLETKGIKFAISNVTHYKGQTNELFFNWSKKYHSTEIKSNYISYHDNSIKSFKEVLVTNFLNERNSDIVKHPNYEKI